MAETFPQLSDGVLHSTKFPKQSDHSEEAGFIVTASADGYDFYFYACPYVLSSMGSGIWIIPEGLMNGTIFFAIPHEQRGAGLRDNAFFRSGWHFNQYLPQSELEIAQEEGQTSWRMAGRQYVWKPGAWEVNGIHGGVTTNLEFRSSAPPVWRWGPWEDLLKNDCAGYKAPCLVDGTIEAGGKTFRVRDGYATHERASVGESRDITAETANGGEVYAFEVRAEGIDIQVHRHTGRGMEAANAIVGGKTHSFGMGLEGTRIVIATLERWRDPRSGLSVPARWHVAASSAEASFDLEIAASGRSYFHYNTKAGVMAMFQILGVANGAFHRTGGESAPIRDAIVGLRWGRGLMFGDERG